MRSSFFFFAYIYFSCYTISTMVDTIIMDKKDNEGAVSLYRRFVKHFRSSGIQSSAKSKRFHGRKLSKNVRKKDCINRLIKKAAYEKAYREGKIPTSHTA